MNFFKKFKICIEKTLHIPMAIVMFLIAVFFSILALRIFADVFIEYINNDFETEYFLERIFLVFLYIEVVTAIKIYFARDFHFPLRFFVYIAITDLVRYTIINHDKPDKILLITVSILILIFGLAILEMKNFYLERRTKDAEHGDFEL